MHDSVAMTRVTTEPLAWETIYQEHGRALLAYLTRLTHDRGSAEDLLQDTFVKAMAAAADLRDESALRSWLYRIATNSALRHLRRGRVLQWLPFTAAQTQADPALHHPATNATQ